MKNIKNNFALYALIIGLLLTFSHTAQAQDVPDGFDPNANSTVVSIAVQTDGKILIGGAFTTLNPNGSGTVARSRIARLNADGTVDTTFNPNANSSVQSIAVQTDGKILIGGSFTALNGGAVPRNRIARLNADGTVDTTFNPNANSDVVSIAVQTDGKILIGGGFTTLNGGAVPRNSIARLNADGTVDTTFNPNANGGVQSIAVQTDGKILIGGFFTTLNGGAVPRNRIARLNADGTVDTTFDPNASSTVYSIAVQTDGKILIGGFFTTLNGGTVTRNFIARLNADGTVDTTFNPNANGFVLSIAVQTDGKILIGGGFTTLNPNGSGAVTRNRIARLNTDGTVDTTFNPNANSDVQSIAVQTDGKILIGGFFTTLKGGTVTRNRIARLGFAPPADLAVSITDSPDPVTAGNNLTYAINLTNSGGLAADTVSLTDTLPANTTFVSLTNTGAALTCTTPAVGGTGTVTCTTPSLAGAASATFTLVVKVNILTPAGTVLSDTVSASTTTAESDTANNSATTTTTVVAVPPMTFTVTRTDDRNNATCAAGDCSLREAVNAANASPANDTINFAISGCPASVCTITLTDDIAVNTTSTAGTLLITNSTGVSNLLISGNMASRVFFVRSGATLTISGLTVTKGNGTGTTDTGFNGAGGGIVNFGALTLTNVVLTANAGVNGGGILNSANLTLTNSTVSGNTSANHGAGIYNFQNTTTLTNSTVSGNTAGNNGGGIYADNATTTTLTNSTVSGNSGNFGGGIINSGGTLSLTNSTVSGNTAAQGGGGIRNDGGTFNLTSVTVAFNTASNGGGVSSLFSSATLLNTIVAKNTGNPTDFDGAIAAGSSFNLIGNGTGTSGISNGDANSNQVGSSGSPIDPKLAPLANNGGATQTHALLFGSPAIDKGNSFTLTTDQRGFDRPVNLDDATYPNATGGDGADIGAYELSSAPIAAFEADVAPRPNGDGEILSNDVVQIRRFLNGTDTADQTTNEFQRADSSPIATLGDGKILPDDVVQARRYQNGTDMKQTAGGPTTQSASRTIIDDIVANLSQTIGENAFSGVNRELRVESTTTSAEETVTVNIRVDSAGDESEYGFILDYDSSVLSNPVIGAGSVGASVRSCNKSVAGQINCSVGGFADNNTNSADSGIGEIQAGTDQVLMTVTFTVAAKVVGQTPLSLSEVNASSDAPQLFVPRASSGTITRLPFRQRNRIR